MTTTTLCGEAAVGADGWGAEHCFPYQNVDLIQQYDTLLVWNCSTHLTLLCAGISLRHTKLLYSEIIGVEKAKILVNQSRNNQTFMRGKVFTETVGMSMSQLPSFSVCVESHDNIKSNKSVKNASRTFQNELIVLY